MYTIGSAYFSFDDGEIGSIKKGKLADLAVLSGDPLTVSDEEFKKLRSESVRKSFATGRQALVSMRSFFHERTSHVVCIAA